MIRITLDNDEWYYDPNKQLGKSGGFGTVYEGTNASQDMDLAIKQLHISAADAAHRELDIAESLTNQTYEHVMEILDSGEDAETGMYFIVMPRAVESLQNKIDRAGKLDELEAVEILLQIARGLAEVEHIIHRDLKPDNILLYDGKWRIADFGIARFVERATSKRTLKGLRTSQYAPPEQWNMEQITNATDIYALGCIAYELLTGNTPFSGTDSELKQRHLAEKPEPLSVYPALRACVSLMLRKPSKVRPSIKRTIEMLEHALASYDIRPVSFRGFHVLAQASADEVDMQAAKEAEEARNRRIVDERIAIGDEAIAILYEEIIENLVFSIKMAAPNVQFSKSGVYRDYTIVFGKAELRYILFDRGRTISKKEFEKSKWDVVVGSLIGVFQKEPEYSWTCNLWYADLGNGEYRWYEVPYYNNQSSVVPFSVNEIYLADWAASPISTTTAYMAVKSPCPIDGENINNFIERWMLLLEKAYRGDLKSPRTLPISDYCNNAFLF